MKLVISISNAINIPVLWSNVNNTFIPFEYSPKTVVTTVSYNQYNPPSAVGVMGNNGKCEVIAKSLSGSQITTTIYAILTWEI